MLGQTEALRPRNSIIVVPTYNEKHNLQLLLPRIFGGQHPSDLCVVDDNSPDGTGALADSLCSMFPRLRVMHRTRKLGLGSAYREAFRAMLREPYDRFISMDADLSHSPELVSVLLRAAEKTDLVIGSRYIPGGGTGDWSFLRRMLSRAANCTARAALGLKVLDATSGFRCYRRDLLVALERLDLRSNGYSFQIEMVYYAHAMGFSIHEVPIVFKDRVHAKSKICRSEIWEAVLTLRRLWGHRIMKRSARDRRFLESEGLGPKGSN